MGGWGLKMICNKIQILLELHDVTAYAIARDLLLYPQTIGERPRETSQELYAGFDL